MKMSFGKYKDVSLEFINSGYFKWLLKQDWFIDGDSDLLVGIEKEMKIRDQNNAHFYEDKIQVGK